MLNLSTIDYAIIGAYFVLAVAVGLWLSKAASRGIFEYFLGGRRIPWWVIGMSGTASNFDMTGTMVIISFVFAIGLQGFWVSMRGGIGLPLGILLVFMGKYLRRSNVMTTAEWMELRFGKGRDGQAARLLSAVSNLVVTMAFLVYFVKGTGKFLSVFLPFSPAVCSLIMIAVASMYTVLSGLYGVVYTDVFQEVLLITVSIYAGVVAISLPDHGAVIHSAGAGWSSFLPQWTADPMTWLRRPDLYHFFGLCILFWVARGIFEGAGGFTGGYMTQRYYAIRSDREAGLMTAQWIVLLFFRWALIVGVAVIGLSLAMNSPEVARTLRLDPEKTLPVVVGQAFPAGLRGLMVAGLVAAAMSTFDSTVNAGAAYWVKDIYQRYLNRNAGRKALMRQSYGATVVLAGVSVGLGLAVYNINEIWGWITGPLSAGLFAPIILRWYWWRFNGFGFAASTAVGLFASLALKIASPNMALFYSFPLTWACSLLSGIVVSLLTKETSTDVLIAFWKKVRPFGLWGRIRKNISDDLVRAARREGRADISVTVFAIGWHLAGVTATISCVLHKWQTAAIFGLAFALLSGILYLYWYRRLQSPAAAQRQWETDEKEIKGD